MFKLNQLRIYKNKVHFANLPVRKNGHIYNYQMPQVPLPAKELMQLFVDEKTAYTSYQEWSWEWMEAPEMPLRNS